MSAKGSDKGKVTPKEHLIGALLNDIKAAWAPGVDKISQEQCALEIVLYCQHKVGVGKDRVKVTIHQWFLTHCWMSQIILIIMKS